MKLRFLVAALALVLLCSSPLLAAESGSPVIEVWKSTTCECCGNWVKHLEANGFTVKVNAASTSVLDKIKKEAGIGDKLASCHTAKIDGYVIEGHVPAGRVVVDSPAKRRGLTNHDPIRKQDTLWTSECREAVQMSQHPFRFPLRARNRFWDI